MYAQQVLAALNEAAGGQTAAEQRAKEIVKQATSPDQKITAIRDFIVKNIRGAGPGLADLPLSAVTKADQTLADGYGNMTDRAVLLYAMLKAVGFSPEFVLVDYGSPVEVLKRFETQYPTALYVRQRAGPPARRRDGRLPQRHESVRPAGHHAGGRPPGPVAGREQGGNGRRRAREEDPPRIRVPDHADAGGQRPHRGDAEELRRLVRRPAQDVRRDAAGGAESVLPGDGRGALAGGGRRQQPGDQLRLLSGRRVLQRPRWTSTPFATATTCTSSCPGRWTVCSACAPTRTKTRSTRAAIRACASRPSWNCRRDSRTWCSPPARKSGACPKAAGPPGSASRSRTPQGDGPTILTFTHELDLNPFILEAAELRRPPGDRKAIVPRRRPHGPGVTEEVKRIEEIVRGDVSS